MSRKITRRNEEKCKDSGGMQKQEKSSVGFPEYYLASADNDTLVCRTYPALINYKSYSSTPIAVSRYHDDESKCLIISLDWTSWLLLSTGFKKKSRNTRRRAHKCIKRELLQDAIFLFALYTLSLKATKRSHFSMEELKINIAYMRINIKIYY